MASGNSSELYTSELGEENMDLKVNIEKTGIEKDRIKAYSSEVDSILGKLWSDKEPFTGWVKLPMKTDREELERILNCASVIQDECRELIVIGVGGSYLGARAAIHALVGFDRVRGTNMPSYAYPEVKFAGKSLSAAYLREFVEDIKKKEVAVCMISKSGTTVDPNVAFSIIKEALAEKYGEEAAARRIFVITDKGENPLRKEAEEKGYTIFDIPENVGGRYSVLSPVGLFPMAVAGIDVKAMLSGAEVMAVSPSWDIDAADYAVARYELMKSGKSMEIFEYYEPALEFFGEWLKQLFAESEGKQGKGLYPDTLQFSADLHSVGQFLQEGKQIFFETVLNIEKLWDDMTVPGSADPLIAGKSMNAINKATMEGVMAAHEAIGIPMVKIDIPELDAFYFGQLIYFFETTCAVSSYLMGVNPFDQPGVEKYKTEMKKNLEHITK